MVAEEEASLTISFAAWGSLTATLVITFLSLSLFFNSGGVGLLVLGKGLTYEEVHLSDSLTYCLEC